MLSSWQPRMAVTGKQCVTWSGYWVMLYLANSAKLFGFPAAARKSKQSVAVSDKAVTVETRRGSLSIALLGWCLDSCKKPIKWTLSSLIFYIHLISVFGVWVLSVSGIEVSLQNQGQEEFNGVGGCWLLFSWGLNITRECNYYIINYIGLLD